MLYHRPCYAISFVMRLRSSRVMKDQIKNVLSSHVSCSFFGLAEIQFTGYNSYDRQISKDLEDHGILNYRSKRAGHKKVKENIPVVITNRFDEHRGVLNERRQELVLILIPRHPSPKQRTGERYAVPKFLFVNICSLLKTKNRIRSSLALEIGLHINDIDICLVSETHFRPDVPDAVIAMSNYALYRRDGNWCGRDV